MFKLNKSTLPPAETDAMRSNSHVANSRVDWIDLTRGVGILLVVIGHAAGGVVDSPVGDSAPAAHILYLGIYSFHMALFFLLAGLFVATRLKANAKGFLISTGTRIGRAYFTWAAIQFTVIYMMGSALNHPADGPYLPQLVAILWKPVSQFWFLYALAFMQLFAFLIVPRLGVLGFLAVTVAVTTAFHLLHLGRVLHWPIFSQFSLYFAWFGAGVAIGPHVAKLRFLQPARPLYLAIAVVAWAGLFFVTFRHFDNLHAPGGIAGLDGDTLYQVAANPLFLPTALAGVATIVLTCSAGLIPMRGYIDYLGRHSMAIFLTHVLFIAGTRIVVLKLLPTIAPALLMAIVALAGLFGSLLFLHAAKQLKIAKALALT